VTHSVASRTVLLRHPVAVAGMALTTVSAVAFVVLLAAVLTGFDRNPYVGLLVFVLVPLLFVIGLVLIPVGMWLESKIVKLEGTSTRRWSIVDFSNPTAVRWSLLVLGLTALNLLLVTFAAGGAVHWMESPSFCGQTCHEPMEPQHIAWQSAAHSQIACTECHVGEGASALIQSKLAGMRQLYHVITRQVPRPVPGVANMRPAQETCGRCHWSGRDIGEVLRTRHDYADDEENSESVTNLQMMLGGPGRKTSATTAIHWHADPDVHIEFVSTDADRQTIPLVRLRDRNGAVKEFKVESATDEQIAKGSRRVMDCIDCHNTPAHRIAQTPEQAVDAAIAVGDINRSLPFVRREGVRLVQAEYPTKEQGLDEIARDLRTFYSTRTTVDATALAGAVTALQTIYRRNVFPSMKVTFGTYPDNIGHSTSAGCFRCHDGEHKAADGTRISDDCEYCHKQLD
jgi:cytochrome c553